MAEPLLLMDNCMPATRDQLLALCRGLGIRCREVAPCEYSLPIGALAGIPLAAKAQPVKAVFSDEMLVMCHMLSPQLDAFLAGMRGAGIPRVDLKAVLTPHNVSWNSVQLHDELAREHGAINRGR